MHQTLIIKELRQANQVRYAINEQDIPSIRLIIDVNRKKDLNALGRKRVNSNWFVINVETSAIHNSTKLS